MKAEDNPEGEEGLFYEV